MSKSTVILGVMTGMALAAAFCGACRCAKGDDRNVCCTPKKSKPMGRMVEDMMDDMADIDMDFVGDMKEEITEDFEELAKRAGHALIYAGKSLNKLAR